MDGYTVASKLHQIEPLSSDPLIVVTSHAILGDKGKYLAADRSRYIKKTTNPKTSVSARQGYLHPTQTYSANFP